jgi:Ca-activated chloride channel family protein
VGWKHVLLLLAAIPGSLLWSQTPCSGLRSSASSPEAASQESEPITTIRTAVQEVNLVFTATDKRGRFKKNLLLSDFAILDDGKPPDAVRSFRGETDLPIRAGLVLDVSGSITSRFTFEQEAAIKFFNDVVRPKTDQAFVVAFDSVPTLTQDFTDDAELLAKGVTALKPGGGSAVFDAIYFAANKKLKTKAEDKSVRRLIILISDGEDNQSRISRDEVLEMARRAEFTIYAISTNTSNTTSRGDKLMAKLAEETGGRAFFPLNIGDVTHAFQTIQEELRSQYALSYRPADFTLDGRYRRIQISTPGDTAVMVRARKGYIASTN